MSKAIYELKHVSWQYEGKPAIYEDFDWEIHPHERWGIIGPSGCGKTTLLYLLAGLKEPQQGEVRFQDKEAKAPILGTSFIQQHYGLFAWKTVRKNLVLPLALRGISKTEANQMVERQLKMLRLTAVANQFPRQLSGGQRQRVAIGRALITKPEVLLMDEPFSALDALTREQLQEECLSLSKESGVTLVLVTHSIEEAVYMCDHLLVFCGAGKNPVVMHNQDVEPNRYSASFVGRCAEIRQMLEEAGYEG